MSTTKSNEKPKHEKQMYFKYQYTSSERSISSMPPFRRISTSPRRSTSPPLSLFTQRRSANRQGSTCTSNLSTGTSLRGPYLLCIHSAGCRLPRGRALARSHDSCATANFLRLSLFTQLRSANRQGKHMYFKSQYGY